VPCARTLVGAREQSAAGLPERDAGDGGAGIDEEVATFEFVRYQR